MLERKEGSRSHGINGANEGCFSLSTLGRESDMLTCVLQTTSVCRINHHITFMHLHSGAAKGQPQGSWQSSAFKSSPQTLDHLFKIESLFLLSHMCMLCTRKDTFPKNILERNNLVISLTYRGIEGSYWLCV